MRRVVPVIVAVLAAILFTARPTYDPDLFWHLAQGREVWLGHLVHTNQFSATAAACPQAYTSWAFEALLAAASSALGMDGVQLLQCVLIACACLMLFAAARVRHSTSAALAVLVISLCVLEPRAMPRPYLISWIGLGACAWCLEHWQRQRRVVHAVGLLCVIAVWANFHSEAVFGAALVGLYSVCAWWQHRASGAESRPYLWIAVAAVAVTLVTPYGIGMWRYLIENALVPQALRIAELQPPTPSTYPAFFAYLAVLAALLLSRPSSLQVSDVAITLVFAALGLRYIRFTPLIVFVAAPIMAARIEDWIARGWDRRAVLVTAAAVCVATLPASPIRMARAWRLGQNAVAPPDVFSSRAIAFSRATGLSGPVFTSMNLGGYVMWALPDARVFQDSRLQAYPPQHFTSILNASESPALWRTLVKDVDWAMVSLARPNELSGVGKFAPDEWAPVFRDRAVEILVRRSGRYAEIARTLELPGA